jgi:hypothetical protein
MKPIEKTELYQHVNQFLKNKGIEVKDGAYAQHLEKSCGLLTDAINLTQKGMERAKSELDKRLDQMRQVIHEKTAPRTGPPPPIQTEVLQTAGPSASSNTKSKGKHKKSSNPAKPVKAKPQRKRSKPR